MFVSIEIVVKCAIVSYDSSHLLESCNDGGSTIRSFGYSSVIIDGSFRKIYVFFKIWIFTTVFFPWESSVSYVEVFTKISSLFIESIVESFPA